jgi:hypothetical protein
MTSRGFLVGAVVASALLLVGCTAQQPPPAEPTPAEIASATREAIDRHWTATGLEGRVPRPDVTEGQLIADQPVGAELGQCVASAGIASWYSDDSGLMIGDGTRGTDEQQLAYYSCYARYPELIVFSAEQREFIYDYYARTYIPCLGFHGYAPSDAPSRESFVSGGSDTGDGWLWSPDSVLPAYPETQEEWEQLYRDCPPTTPGIEGWSYTMVFE